MDTDTVFISEGLTIEVDGAHGHSGGVQGVDPQVRRTTSMRGPSDKLDAFGYSTVVCVADSHLLLGRVARGMEHHCQMDVVELA